MRLQTQSETFALRIGAAIEDSRGPEMYHASPRRNRESIQQHGLMTSYTMDDPEVIPGIYMSPKPSQSPYDDVWAVDTSKLQHLEPDDPSQSHEFRDVGGSYWTKHDVPLDAMRFHRPATKDY